MDPQIKNFTAIEQMITTRPRAADARAQEWNSFVNRHPEVAHFQLKQEFDAWANTHNLKDTSVWLGKEIKDAYFYLRQTHEQKQSEQSGSTAPASIPSELVGLPFLAAAFLQKPKTLEEDGDYIKMLKKKAEEKLKKIPGKNDTEKVQSKEWIDYRYGSLEKPEQATLFEETEKTFREDPHFAKRLERYDKERDKQRVVIHKKFDEDPEIVAHRWRIEYHSQMLIAEQKKQNPKITKEDEEKIVQQVRDHHWEKFAKRFPEKASAYAEKHEGIKNAIVRVAERKKQEALQKEAEAAITQEPPVHNEEKNIPHVEEKLHQTPDINVTETLQPSRITPPAQSEQTSPVDTQEKPIPNTPPLSQARPVVLPQPPRISTSPLPSRTSPVTFVPGRPPSPQIPRVNIRGSSIRPPKPPFRGLGRARRLLKPGNPLSSIGSKIARQAMLRLLLFFVGPLLFIAVSTLLLVLAIGPATNIEASPEYNSNEPLANCLFTRAGTSKPIGSNKLISLFQEVSAKSGIPASVLATLAMHESQDFTINAKDDHDAFSSTGITTNTGCVHFGLRGSGGASSTGALGLMQVQPPLTILPSARADAYSKEGVKKGAELAGKTLESLTMQDFCDVRTSIYLGAGVIIAKNGGNPPTTSSEVNKSVCGYYGACEYGGYNYGAEAQKDFENCQQLTSSTGGNSGSSGAIIPVGQGGERAASSARQIASQLVHSTRQGMTNPYCDPGILHGGPQAHYIGFHCWSEMANPKYDQARDPDYLQCTEFVWAAFEKAGFGNEINLINGNAQDWVASAKARTDIFATFGESDVDQLQPGDIISLGSAANDIGHVAIVIDKKRNVVEVAQSATDFATESWDIKGNKLIPYDQANRPSRTIVKGFIRLIKTPTQ